MVKSTPTIADIAKKANVSVSTVSYAINGTRTISEETRQRIFAVMNEFGYQPNALARGLASKKSHIIALLYPDIGLGLGATALGFFFATAETARQNGYNLVLWPNVIHAKDLDEHLRQGLVDGVIVMEVTTQDERVDFLRNSDIPFSMIGRTADSDNLSYVDIEFQQSIREAIEYLAHLGHTHIAFLNKDKGSLSQGNGPAVRTQAAFLESIQQMGLVGITHTAECEPNAGYEAFNHLLAQDPDLTAIITINDYSSPGIVQAIIDRGWSIPNDFSIIVGPTSPQMAEMLMPPSTSMEIPIVEMSVIGVKQLLQQLENPKTGLSQMLIPCHFTVRGSTGPCKSHSHPD
jgi:DNA-binding LacI/PurR family transcriptional regulator